MTDSAVWSIACLCAAWCRTCDEYRPLFDAHARAQPEAAHRWIDVEDEADALGDLDVETFPTLLIARGGVPVFFGPVLPRAGSIDALLGALGAAATPTAVSAADELAPLLAHLQLAPRTAG